MPRITVTAKAECIYEGVPRPNGKRFDCELSDARVLRQIGRVDFKDDVDVVTDAPSLAPEDSAQPVPTRKTRGYRRRDMAAEN